MLKGACLKWFSYDDLDRLTSAQYGIEDQNEVFTYDDLGNRESVNVRSGSNVTYVVDANNNRYISVGGNSLAYNDAGDLTTDKDDYDFEYDYENRITKIKDTNSVTVAEYAYDALGRRVRKIDSKASETTLYYHNNNWQVLADANSSGVTQRWYIYGNYIDEALRMTDATSGNSYYYIHDHLYSPVALTDSSGSVVERYEYDVYGNARVLDADYAADADGLSDYGNPYLFTGRRVDMLDGGAFVIQYNRNRYYDQYTGRWLTPDPLGIVPNAQRPNRFDPLGQYADGGNLYEYVNSTPIIFTDAWGLMSSPAPPSGSIKIIYKVTVTRDDSYEGYATRGTFVARVANMSGFEEVTGDTMEPKEGHYDLGYGDKDYPIPTGEWEGAKDREQGEWAIYMVDRPETNFTDLLIHAGKDGGPGYPINTAGCIIAGEGWTSGVLVFLAALGKSTEDWNRYVVAGMIKEVEDLPGGTYGITDEIHNTKEKMQQMHALYRQLLDKCTEDCVQIKVVVE